MLQECWQKGMVVRDTDWKCYSLNSQGPCGPSQRIVYTNRYQSNEIKTKYILIPSSVCVHILPAVSTVMTRIQLAQTTLSATKASASTLKTRPLVEQWQDIVLSQTALENTLASARQLSASSNSMASAGLATSKVLVAMATRWRRTTRAKSFAEKIPAPNTPTSLLCSVPATSAINCV